MSAIEAEQQTLKQARKERRMNRNLPQDRPQVAEPANEVRPQAATLRNDDRPQVAEPERPWVAEQDRPQVADIPLSVNPLEEPLSKNISANQNGSGRKTAISKHSGSNPDFESFWQAYPKRVGRLKAEKCFASAVSSGISAEVLVAGAERYAAERFGDDPRFTKHPSTWLNAGCWNDEPQKPVKPKFGAGFQGFFNGGGNNE
jgi:hypothetical protein